MRTTSSRDVNKMPPKKKAGKGGKKKKGKPKDGDGGGELSVEEMYKRTAQEVHSLKERLAERQEYARRSRASEEVMRDQMMEAKSKVDEEKVMKRELTYDLTRQYKTMQTQMEGRIDFLESQVKKLQAELDKTRSELAVVTEERDRVMREKEEQHMALMGKIQSMERSYEAILQDAMDALAAKIESARSKWDDESRAMEGKAMQVLLEFGRGTL